MQLPCFNVAQQPRLHASQAPALVSTNIDAKRVKIEYREVHDEGNATARAACAVHGVHHLIISRRSHGVRHAQAKVASRRIAAATEREGSD